MAEASLQAVFAGFHMQYFQAPPGLKTLEISWDCVIRVDHPGHPGLCR
jgi:hypothetical protein